MTSTMEWIRRQYDVPARHGMRITYDGKPATITGAGGGGHLRFRIDGEKHITAGHPCYRIVYPAMPEPVRPRGWCKHCGKDRALKGDVMGRHQWHGRTYVGNGSQSWSELCPGSGQPPWKPVRNQTHPGEQRPES